MVFPILHTKRSNKTCKKSLVDSNKSRDRVNSGMEERVLNVPVVYEAERRYLEIRKQEKHSSMSEREV